jgi:CheY-like chemotaxis protein
MNKPTILLVEDDENDVIFMRHAWEKAAVANRLQVVPDGQKAVDYLDGSGEYADRAAYPLPCLVLLDLNLPYRHGFEVIQWIRKRPEFKTLVVIVFTASPVDVDARKAYELGANGYVIKPPSPDKLREFLSALKLFWLDWNYAPWGMADDTSGHASVPEMLA